MELKIVCGKKIVGETSLIKEGKRCSMVSELFEHPRLQCEKVFKSQLKVI